MPKNLLQEYVLTYSFSYYLLIYMNTYSLVLEKQIFASFFLYRINERWLDPYAYISRDKSKRVRKRREHILVLCEKNSALYSIILQNFDMISMYFFQAKTNDLYLIGLVFLMCWGVRFPWTSHSYEMFSRPQSLFNSRSLSFFLIIKRIHEKRKLRCGLKIHISILEWKKRLEDV